MSTLEILKYQFTKNVYAVIVEHNLPVSSVDIVTAATGRQRELNQRVLAKYSPPATRIVEQPLAGKRMATDVHGHQIESICNYHTCSHKFSLHGHSGSKCKCRHPLNYALWKSVP
jgi:hypothetical protein